MRSNIEPLRFRFKFQLGDVSSTSHCRSTRSLGHAPPPHSDSSTDDLTSPTVDSTRVTLPPLSES